MTDRDIQLETKLAEFFSPWDIESDGDIELRKEVSQFVIETVAAERTRTIEEVLELVERRKFTHTLGSRKYELIDAGELSSILEAMKGSDEKND